MVLSLTLIASLVFTLVATWNAPVVAMETASLATASAVPADAQFYLAVDIDSAGEQLTQTLELLERGGFADSEDSLATIVSPGVGARGANLETVDDLVDGQIAVAGTGLNFDALGALSDFGMDGDLGNVDVDELGSNVSSGIGIVITASNMAEVIDELEAEFREDAAVAGMPVEETEADGARILVVEADETTGEAGNAMAILNDVVILGGVVEDVLPFVQAEAGVVPALASDLDFVETMAQLPADTLMAAYSPALTDFESVEQLLGEAGVSLALDLLVGPGGASGFAVSADDAGFRVDTVQLARAGEQFEPAGVASGLTLADRVPSDSLLLVNGFDLGSSLSFRLIEQLLVVATGTMSGTSEAMPEMSQVYIDSQLASFAPLLGFNPQTDFIQQLQGEFGIALTQVDPVDPANIEAIITSEVADPLVVADALGSLGALIQAGAEGQAVVSTVTIGDASVNQVAVTSDTGDINVQYGVVGDEFALSVGDSLVEYALGGGEPLSANEEFQDTMALLPAEYDGLFYLAVSELAAAGEPMLGGLTSGLNAGLQDASDRCAEFTSQSAAQAAYDEDPIANFDLDLDFDGVACSDYVAGPSSGSPVAVLESQVNGGSFAAVSYKQDGMAFTSGILVITDEE